MQQTKTLNREPRMACNLALKSRENEVPFLRTKEVYITAKGDELHDLVANLARDIRDENGSYHKNYNAKRRQVNRLQSRLN